jgi:raffinose/stachyose/melibiose transport system permease protein
MRHRNNTGKLIRYILLYILLILFIMPFYIMVINSFKTTEQFIISPFSFPQKLDFNNYISAFLKMRYLDAISNSIIITLLSVFLILLTSSMAAYFLVRYKWRINKIIFAVFVASMIVPFQALMIPLVSIYGRMGLMNSKWVLIYMYTGFGQAFAVFILHGFIKSIPWEIEEAAFIDGSTKMQTYFLVVLPLLKPALLTVLILDVLWIWNDYLLPSLILLSPSERTLPLSTYSFFNSYSVDFAPLMAGIILTIIPVLFLYLFSQRQILKGIVQGAIK